MDGDNPDPLASLVAEGGCQYPAWDATVSYDRKDQVSYGNHDWRAKKPSQGIAPGSHPAYWGDLGACAGDPGDPE